MKLLIALGLLTGLELGCNRSQAAIEPELAARQTALATQAAALAQKYPFTAPATGKLMLLDDERVASYLRVRAAVLPIWVAIQQRKAEMPKPELDPEAMEHLAPVNPDADLVTGPATVLQEQFVAQLEKLHMSPAQFMAITVAVYQASHSALVSQRRASVQSQVDGLTELLAKTPPKKGAKFVGPLVAQQRDLKAQLAAMADGVDDEAGMQANAPVLARFQPQVDAVQNANLDSFLGRAVDRLNRLNPSGAPPPVDGGEASKQPSAPAAP